VTYNATIGPSAILLERLMSSRKPPHFRVFLTEALLSPPKPIHSWPSAVPAAMAPVDETERQSTKGGDNDTPDDCGSEARKMCDPTRTDRLQGTTY
jgi:hypothetical protein